MHAHPNSSQTLLLIDGSSYLYRAFHALPDLRSPEGFPTGALHGMAAMVKRLRDQHPAHLGACVFDAKGPTFRDGWYPAYKAQRAPMPPDLALQIEPIHEMVKLMGWPVLTVPGIEADDTIGTLSHVASQQRLQVIISTGDKDMAQLVNAAVSLVNTMSQERLDVAGVTAKFGVPPERIIDYLTLMGDTVDNVPGVDKVGPKTAAKWIAEYGSLEGVMAAAPSMKGAVGENLRRALEWLPQAKRLVTVVLESDLSDHVKGWPALDALALGAVDVPGLLDFYARYGFKSLRKELLAQMPLKAPHITPDLFAQPLPCKSVLPEGRYETVLTWEALDAWLAKLQAAALAALDTETTSLNPLQAQLVGLSFSTEPGVAAYVPLQHNYPGAPEQLPQDQVLEKLRPWLENPQAAKVGQNIKYDLHVLQNCGVTVRGYQHDTLLQSYVLEAHQPHGLESLAQRHLGRKGLGYEELCGKGAHQISFTQVDVERATQYAGEDSEMTLQLHQYLYEQLQAQPQLLDVYQRIEMPTAAVLQTVERHGVCIDASLLATQSQQLGQRLIALEQEAYALAGQPFNMGSPKQVGEILFGKLGLPTLKKTAKGSASTDEDVLIKLAQDYPLPDVLLAHRSLSKLKNTYTDKLPQMVNAATGRVHTNYAQAVAVTGRLSSNEPNLQNIPIRTPEGRRVREAFVAPPGYVILSADYSQIELRIMAHLSNDASLLNAFAQGLDVHSATASEVFNVPLQDVTSEQRRYAKVINFGLIYGMSAFGLAGNLKIERSAASSYIDRYFARYPGVKRYMDDTRDQAKSQGYVETVFGRRLWLPEINSPSGPRRAGAERAAINAPMQGTAADLIKLAMVAVQQAISQAQRASRMVMQVHDELVLEVPHAELEWARQEVPRLMAGVVQLKVPLLAQVGVGKNWEMAH
jgi:DNA polymerase I